MNAVGWSMLALVLLGCAPEPAAPPEAPVPAATPADEPGSEFSAEPWEASRRAGYAFRGIGQEPGWTVEIAPGREIRALLDYGEREIVTAAPSVTREGSRTTYHARTDAAALWVVVEETPCSDAMSGERMTHTVTLRIDGRVLEGCGREL